jgi:hypothetical protein
MTAYQRTSLRSPYQRRKGRQPNLTITLGEADMRNFEALKEVLQNEHRMSVSRSWAAKYAIALASMVVAKAVAERRYEQLAENAMKAME